MPANSKDALARKNARRYERLKAQRARERKHPPEKRTPRAPKPDRRTSPFVGCDGEGIGRKDHRYNLFRMGSRELFNGGKRLTTGQLLAFILDHPSPADILVGFAFEYDANCILRDVRRERDNPKILSRLERLLGIEIAALKGEAQAFKSHSGWTWLHFKETGSIGVMLLKRNYLKVCRLRVDQAGRAILSKKGSPQSAPGSIRTIFETWGFFQGSFVAALKNWRIGTAAERSTMLKMKNRRASFERITSAIRRYNADECVKLAATMEKFRRVCLDLDLIPLTWNGAGKLASTMLKEAGIIKRKRLLEITPDAVIEFAHAAYYGGRFEISRVGMISEPVYDCDINSAYPAAMLQLPCLEHGSWRKLKGSALAALPADALYVAEVRYDHKDPTQKWCGIPHRTAQAKLVWRRRGIGVYWSPEIRSAVRLGATVAHGEGYVFEKGCNCPPPFAFVLERYQQRLKIGKGSRGLPIKLALNALYGKLAQRIGNPTFQNPIYAGLATAIVRAQLNDAIIAAGPANVVMLATDAIVVTGQAPRLNFGKGLGQWGLKDYPSLFVVRPGLYWSPDKIKTRGIGLKFFTRRMTRTFEKQWSAYIAAPDYALRGAPKIPVPIKTFVSLLLAYRLNDPTKACQWLKKSLVMTFDWGDKRRQGDRHADGRSLHLEPHAGDSFERSRVYTASVLQEWHMKDEETELQEITDVREWFSACPDPIDLSPPI